MSRTSAGFDDADFVLGVTCSTASNAALKVVLKRYCGEGRDLCYSTYKLARPHLRQPSF